jgi:hypothetical protein
MALQGFFNAMAATVSHACSWTMDAVGVLTPQHYPTPQSPSPLKGSPMNGMETPPTPKTMQPSFPLHAVKADSRPHAQSMQRRPAYLLHHDLVIGKGSSRQVYIASRKETKGHTLG